jgi:poly(3-hydroxybutyrate) depolymerase
MEWNVPPTHHVSLPHAHSDLDIPSRGTFCACGDRSLSALVCRWGRSADGGCASSAAAACCAAEWVCSRKWAPSGLSNVEIKSADGTELKGWYAEPSAWNRDSVILLHGVGDNREGVTSYAAMFLRSGYAMLLPDSRAQGESGGQIGTYGLLESGDLQRWSGWIAHRAGSDIRESCTYFFGESMGAAIALESTAAQPEVCAVVAEAPFSSFREIGYSNLLSG